MSEPLTPAEVQVLVDTIREQRAEIARLRSNQPLLGVLREIALDPSVPPHVRLKAAEVGVGYETPKLTANVSHNTNMNFGTTLIRRNQENKENPELAQQRRLDALLRIEARGLRVVEGEGA